MAVAGRRTARVLVAILVAGAFSLAAPAAHATPAPVPARSTSVGLPDISPVGVAAVRTAAGSVVAFVRGTDGAVWDTTTVGGVFGGFQRIPSAIIGGPAAVSRDGSVIDLFAVGTDRALWHTWTIVDRRGRPRGFAPWESLGGILTTGPAVASLSSPTLLVSGRGADDAVWSRSWHAGAWGPWTSDGGRSISAPALELAVPNNFYVVHVIGTDGKDWRAFLDSGNGNAFEPGWSSSGGPQLSTAPGLSPDAGWEQVPGARGDVIGSAVRLFWSAHDEGAEVGGIVTSSLALVQNGTTSLWTFGRGADNALWLNVLTTTGWTWSRIGGVLA